MTNDIIKAWLPSWACQLKLALPFVYKKNDHDEKEKTLKLNPEEKRTAGKSGYATQIFHSQNADNGVGDSAAICNSGVKYRYLNENFTMSNSIPSMYQQLLRRHPELYVWDKCKLQVYPYHRILPSRTFDPNEDRIPCNCRVFRFDINSASDEDLQLADFVANHNQELYANTTNQTEIHSRLAANILERVLAEWDMLQVFFFEDRANRITLNMTAESIYSAGAFMLVFDLSRVTIKDASLPSAISKWSNINYLKITYGFISTLPDSFRTLTNLKYADLSNNELWTFPEQLCDLSLLTGIKLEFCKFPAVPACVVNLPRLQSFMVSGKNIPKNCTYVRIYVYAYT
ncbi:hypothetical protein RFI_09033 [Reticulomyxa filosa]|uniref:Uncharacterized protein n=1 Tax=Reticulomyxa filosa TaxID=46433 RepID=X6NP92_RETFI|nr:hypothetical protein RFI_09033 [Reticulomyxa filosa]|eukprot:ETO28100.1 hypothetical protein RFI_09033 [Reticulomyxa filosa]